MDECDGFEPVSIVQAIKNTFRAPAPDDLAAKMDAVALSDGTSWDSPVLTQHDPALFDPTTAPADFTPGGAGLLPFSTLDELEQQLEASGGRDLLARPHRSPPPCRPLLRCGYAHHVRPPCSPAAVRAVRAW